MSTDTTPRIRPTDTDPDTATTTDHRTTSTAASRPARRVGDAPKEKTFDLSLTQILGGALAAATAATLGARLGVAGTVVGAAVASLVSAVAGSLYTASLRKTRTAALAAVDVVRVKRDGDTQVIEVSAAPDVPEEEPPASPVRERRRRPRARAVLLGTLAIFALTAAGITGWELASGTSLDGRTGTTIQQVGGGGGAATTAPAENDRPTAPASESAAPTSTGSAPSSESAAPSSAESTPSSESAAPSSPAAPSSGSAAPSTSDAPAEPSGAAAEPSDAVPAG